MSYESLSEDQRYQLIQLVKERPVIYDKQNDKYKNAAEKEIAWQEVANRCNAQVTACKVAWKTMRDQYQRNMKLPQEQRKNYRYLSKLSFLSEFSKGADTSSTSFDDITEYYYENTMDMPKDEIEYDSTEYGDYNETTTTTIEPIQTYSNYDQLPTKSAKQRLAGKGIANDIQEFSSHAEEYIYLKDDSHGDGNVENIASELFETFSNLINKRFQPNEDDNDIFLKMLAKKMKPLPKLVKNRLQESFLEQVNYEIINYEVQRKHKK
ncbi:uncharacterized protein LOC106086716 [Stomoxys calcitrans]|uniref:MADF domain-containing protein n=1 Tax=Stomoxys calcitrans TaxID=35570 RepID=A0A1I8QCJ2_STOCA|nr:uncharacterized protein LOC106086716 [Stomoxys calcitrans]